MNMEEIIIKVPKEYLRDAEDFGMLDSSVIAQILQDELDKRIMALMDSKVKAHRKERRSQRTLNQKG
jgi:hypothetical protein